MVFEAESEYLYQLKVEKLQAENARLKDALQLLVDYLDMPHSENYPVTKKNPLLVAREALKDTCA